MRALLDVNVLIALLDSDHLHRIKGARLEWHLLKLRRMAIFSDSLLSDYAGLSQ